MEREPVLLITTERGTDLVVGYAIPIGEPGEVASLVLVRTPMFERLLPPEDRGVSVSHELHSERGEQREVLKRIVVARDAVEIESTARTYHLDLSLVDAEEREEAESVIRRMHRHGGFELVLE
jgi:hypothetical protein